MVDCRSDFSCILQNVIEFLFILINLYGKDPIYYSHIESGGCIFRLSVTSMFMYTVQHVVLNTVHFFLVFNCISKRRHLMILLLLKLFKKKIFLSVDPIQYLVYSAQVDIIIHLYNLIK